MMGSNTIWQTKAPEQQQLAGCQVSIMSNNTLAFVCCIWSLGVVYLKEVKFFVYGTQHLGCISPLVILIHSWLIDIGPYDIVYDHDVLAMYNKNI
jgi:ABC-type multidrug transport system permease subunit